MRVERCKDYWQYVVAEPVERGRRGLARRPVESG